jgi:protein-S-isoprenylcysteine O-methyltransferase Ste14
VRTREEMMSDAAVDREKLRRKRRHLRDSLRQSLGILLVVLFTIFGRPVAPWFWLGAAAVLFGIAVRLWASGFVKKNEELATGGPYARVRHPLYVGNILLSLGFCLAAWRWWAWALIVAFFLYFYPTAIRREDAKLHRLFGESWEKWSSTTAALLPRFERSAASAEGEWSFLFSLRRNGEPLIAAFLLACLLVLYSRVV